MLYIVIRVDAKPGKKPSVRAPKTVFVCQSLARADEIAQLAKNDLERMKSKHSRIVIFREMER